MPCMTHSEKGTLSEFIIFNKIWYKPLSATTVQGNQYIFTALMQGEGMCAHIGGKPGSGPQREHSRSPSKSGLRVLL